MRRVGFDAARVFAAATWDSTVSVDCADSAAPSRTTKDRYLMRSPRAGPAEAGHYLQDYRLTAPGYQPQDYWLPAIGYWLFRQHPYHAIPFVQDVNLAVRPLAEPQIGAR